MFRRRRSQPHRYDPWLDIAGWYGVLAVLAAYAAVNSGWLTITSSLYLWLNLTGSAAIAAEAYIRRDYQPVVLNLVWLLIALWGLLRFLG